MEIIKKYFPQLTERQTERLAALESLYREWNEKINIISRKDIGNLYERHVLHSLSIAHLFKFKAGAHILDLGTGGGFPGIPLAILFPETQFKLIDGTRKKISVVQAIAKELSLDNVVAQQIRAEELKKEKFDFVVSRAVASLDKLLMWSKPLIHSKQQHAQPNGLIALKGGKVAQEIRDLPKGEYTEQYALSEIFEESFFAEKFLIYVQI